MYVMRVHWLQHSVLWAVAEQLRHPYCAVMLFQPGEPRSGLINRHCILPRQPRLIMSFRTKNK